MNRRGAFLPLTLVIFGLAVGCSSDSDPVNNSPAEVSTELNNLSSSLKQHGIDMNGERVTGLKVLSPCENDFLSALKGSMDKIDEIKKKFESNIGAFTPQQKERTKSKVNNLQANMKETHEELSLFCKEDQPAIKACVDTEQFVTVLLNRHAFDNRISDPVVRVLDFRARNKYLNDNRLRLQQSGDKGQLVVVQVIDGDYYQSSLSHQQKDHLKAEKGSMHLIENCLFVAGMKSETGKLVQEIVSKTAKRLW